MITLPEIQLRLRESLKNSGMKGKDIAKAVGVAPAQISKYMRNNIFPSLDTLANLCKVLDVSADYILCLTDA